jgi:aspartate/methionine/tyrosine aminotransferase
VKPSTNITTIPRSGIRAIMELAWTVPDAIHLEVGEPNFTTPAHIVAAAAEAAAAGFTRYTPNAGIPELREALAGKVRERNGIQAGADQVIVTPGSVAGLFSTLTALVDPGSEVLLADPAWPNYELMMRLLGITPVRFRLHPERGLIPDAAEIEPLITERTRAIVLNSPGNPTGAITPPEVLADLLELSARHDLWVLTDEVYDEIWFDHPPAALAPLDSEGRVITFFSFSKTYAMTGWRVGYLVAPADVVGHIIKAQEPITSCVNAPAQKAAVAAITGPQDCVADMRASYHERRDRVGALLDDRGLPYVRPTGAFYLMADISGSGLSDVEFATRLVRERGVAVVPGTTFGPNSGAFVRISLATAAEPLLEGVGRLADAVEQWGAES